MSAIDDLIGHLESVQAQSAPAPEVAPRTPMQPPQPMSGFEQLLAKVPTGLVNNPVVTAIKGAVMGAADPVVGAAQLVANALPDSTGIPQAVNSAIRGKEEGYQAERGKDAGVEVPILGKVDPARFVGNAASPVNLAMALRAAPAVGAGARAIQGAEMGAAGGAMAPTQVDPESGKFWGPKAAQVGIGAAAGGVFAPIAGAIADKVGALVARQAFDPAKAAQQADSMIGDALKESGQKLSDLPADQLGALRSQVINALSTGKKMDAAALARLGDFQREGIQPTQGWVTRDPMQFADEQAMKSMSKTLNDVMATGNREVTSKVSRYAADAADAPTASQALAAALRTIDEKQRGAVTAAYTSARNSAGKDLEIPMQGLAQDYANIARDFEGAVPKGIQHAFEDYGLISGKQTKAFTFESADDLLKKINAYPAGTPAEAAALGKLRAAVKNAATSVDASGGPFAPAVKLAAERFAQHDAIPALEAAVRAPAGEVPDNFLAQHVINSKSTPEVQRLAALLREQAPEVYQETRQQIGAELTRRAFGENVAGDKPVAQEAYNRALRQLGDGKLSAFFEPHEVEQMRRLGRIASYQQSNPAAAATNFSNTAGTMANILRALGWVPVAGKTVQTAGEKLGGYAATRPTIPATPALSDDQRLLLSNILNAGAGASGLALSSRLVGK